MLMRVSAAPAESFNSASTSPAGARPVRCFADTRVITDQLELDFCMRQEPQTVADLLRDGDLALSRDLHSNTPTSKNNTYRTFVASWAGRHSNR